MNTTNALSQRIRKHMGTGNGSLITDTVYGEEAIAPGLQSFALGHYEHRLTAQGASASLASTGVSEYIYIPTAQGPMPIAAQINGRLYAIHTDQLNTPRQLTDENGHKVWQWGISGFGEVEATTAETGWIRARNGSAGQRSHTQPVTFNLRFPGQQFDEESGLHYNHHRYYDPYLTVGYTDADPLGLQAGWNRFLYAEGDPLGFSDAEGLANSGWQPSKGLRDLKVPAACAEIAFFKNYLQLILANTIGADKYFHCKANCEAAKCGEAGRKYACMISDAREWIDLNIKNYPLIDSIKDQIANHFGRSNSKNPNHCEEICRNFRPNGLPLVY